MDFETIAIVFIVLVVMPAVMFNGIKELKKTKSMSAEGEASLTDLIKSADQLEDRVRILERILDDEVPDWRSRHYDRS